MKQSNEQYSRDELRPGNTGRSIPDMGWNTNEDIGGVPDWQDVGKETGSTDPYPNGHGPVGALLSKEPVRGSNGGANISLPPIRDVEQGYNVGLPKYQPEPNNLITTKTADTTNSDTNTLDTTASTANLSAKYKYPNVRQDTSQMPPNPSGEEPSI